MLFISILDFYAGNGPESSGSVPCYYHSYLPDEVEFEGLTPQEQQSLKLMGYHLHMLNRQYGDMQVVYWDRKNNKVYAASDPRRQGKPMVKAVKK